MSLPPVVAIDGPSGSGKGAVGQRLAARLGWHYLDSGALYRALGLVVGRAGIALTDTANLSRLAGVLDLQFPLGRVLLSGEDVTEVIRSEECGRLASRVAAVAPVRTVLLQKQRDQRQPPGLVADGRDMGTVVFPDAIFKVFLTAGAEIRAERRYKQLKEKGFDVNLPRLLGEIRERDTRDAGRAASPLKPAEGAYIVDTSALTITQVVDAIWEHLRERLK